MSAHDLTSAYRGSYQHALEVAYRVFSTMHQVSLEGPWKAPGGVEATFLEPTDVAFLLFVCVCSAVIAIQVHSKVAGSCAKYGYPRDQNNARIWQESVMMNLLLLKPGPAVAPHDQGRRISQA